MAADWIKIEKVTVRKREVLLIAGELAIHPDHAFGLCFRFWSWCDDNLTDGHAAGVTSVLLDQLLGHTGFSKAAVNAGWLRDRANALEVPHFDRHLSQSAKNRALAADRKRKSRDNQGQESPPERDDGHAPGVTKAGPEKRREDSTLSHPNAPPGEPPTVEECETLARDHLKADPAFAASFGRQFHGIFAAMDPPWITRGGDRLLTSNRWKHKLKNMLEHEYRNNSRKHSSKNGTSHSGSSRNNGTANAGADPNDFA